MTRIFVTLAFTAIAMLLANMFVGLTGGDYNGASLEVRTRRMALGEVEMALTPDQAAINQAKADYLDATARIGPLAGWMTFHRIFGVLASLTTMFVSSIGVTYFIGTSRWVREVIEAYGFDVGLIRRSNVLKRLTFAWALCAMLTIVVIVACGAAADPGTLRATTAEWVNTHMLIAMGGVGLIAVCLWQIYGNIVANQAIIQNLVGQVAEVRKTKGLEQTEELSV